MKNMSETYELLTRTTITIEEDTENGLIPVDNYMLNSETDTFLNLQALMNYIVNTYDVSNVNWIYTDTKSGQTKITGFCINHEETKKEDDKTLIETETLWLSIYKVITTSIIEDELKTILNEYNITINGD